MSVLESRVNTRSQAFKDNEAAMLALVDQLREEVGKVKLGGGDRARAKHVGRGKLLPRERVRMLLDPGSPFLEFSQLAAHGMYSGDIASAGVITGIGRVKGQECVVVCNDATVKAELIIP